MVDEHFTPMPARPAMTGPLDPMPMAGLAVLTEAGRAALADAAALARSASAPATLRAYKSDWAHYAAWCARTGFMAVPAEPATVGAYLASLTNKAPTTVRRRLAALGRHCHGNWRAAVASDRIAA